MYDLAYPCVLLLWFLPIVIYKGLKPVSVEYKFAIRVPFFADYFHHEQTNLRPHQSCMWFYHWIGIWTLLVFALAGPRWVGPPQSLSSEARNIMMVLDISGSMGLQDMPNGNRMQTRWSVVKNKALDFVSKRPEDKIGLILFGERAYLFAPLTHDQSTLVQRINDASVGLAGQATALGDAMGLAIKHLKNTPTQGRVMILLTDGVANAGVLSPIKAAAFAKAQQIKIYAIGLGPQNDGKSLSGIFWQLQHANDLDEATLKKMASMTHGKYYRANDAQSLNDIYQDIERLEPSKQVRNFLRIEKEYYHWPLSLAFIWMMLLFMRQVIKDRRIS
jgi:Ca-activated chloride channel family protein